jgi:cytidine deaminase
MNIKEEAINECLGYRLGAIARNTKVGATLYTDDQYVGGYNIENRCHKGLHAEEVAIMNARMCDIKPSELKGMIISFSSNDITNLTFACGHCRQALWEYTYNPKLLITEVDLEGNIVAEKTLGELYPYPFPREGKGKIAYEGI